MSFQELEQLPGVPYKNKGAIMFMMNKKDLWKEVAVGIATALILSAVSVTGMKTGISPLPKPLVLAFAETIFGRSLPLPVGLFFHVAWVTFSSVIYVAMFRHKMTFLRALGLSAVLWLSTLVIFFPLVGWGFFELNVSPMLIIGSAVPHLLFAIILWGLCRLSFHDEHAALRPAHR
jgi:hypothetical protein